MRLQKGEAPSRQALIRSEHPMKSCVCGWHVASNSRKACTCVAWEGMSLQVEDIPRRSSLHCVLIPDAIALCVLEKQPLQWPPVCKPVLHKLRPSNDVGAQQAHLWTTTAMRLHGASNSASVKSKDGTSAEMCWNNAAGEGSQ